MPLKRPLKACVTVRLQWRKRHDSNGSCHVFCGVKGRLFEKKCAVHYQLQDRGHWTRVQ